MLHAAAKLVTGSSKTAAVAIAHLKPGRTVQGSEQAYCL